MTKASKLRAKWVKALRSGQYKQGRGTLCRLEASGIKFCCLGVLCDVFDETRWYSPGSAYRWFSGDGPIPFSGILPPDVQEAIRMKKSDVETLINLNDTGQVTFNEIADIIEKSKYE